MLHASLGIIWHHLASFSVICFWQHKLWPHAPGSIVSEVIVKMIAVLIAITSITAQGGGGSFKDRKPTG